MKVVLKQDVKGLGKKGEKVKVLKGDFIDEFVKDIYSFLEEKSE